MPLPTDQRPNLVTVRVRKEDHDAVKAYYRQRGAEVRLIADPSVIWPVCEEAEPEYDRFRELD